MEHLKWLWEQIIDHWIGEVISLCFAILIPSLRYFALFLNGKEDMMKPERKKYFFLVYGGLVFVACLAILTGLKHFNEQVEDIRRASPSHGELHAAVISAVKTAGPSSTATNAIGTPAFGDSSKALDGHGFNFIFVIHVVNSGLPTTAWNWQASLTMPNGQILPASIPGVTGISADPIPTARGPYQLSTENNLLQKLAFDPLVSGGGVSGWLIVHVDGLEEPPMNSRFTITFDDAFNRQTKIIHEWNPPFSHYAP